MTRTGRGITYSDEHRQFIKVRWEAGKSAREVAEAFSAHFQIPCSRNAVIGVVTRLRLPKRDTVGVWRSSGDRRRQATLLAKRLGSIQEALEGALTPFPEKPAKTQGARKDLPAPSPIGPLVDFPQNGCKWVVVDLPDFQCCGHPRHGSGPYCEAHHSKAIDHTKRTKLARGPSRSDKAFWS